MPNESSFLKDIEPTFKDQVNLDLTTLIEVTECIGEAGRRTEIAYPSQEDGGICRIFFRMVAYVQDPYKNIVIIYGDNNSEEGQALVTIEIPSNFKTLNLTSVSATITYYRNTSQCLTKVSL